MFDNSERISPSLDRIFNLGFKPRSTVHQWGNRAGGAHGISQYPNGKAATVPGQVDHADAAHQAVGN